MPNISSMEMVILAASLSLFMVIPGVLSWADERRQRRLAATPRFAPPVDASGVSAALTAASLPAEGNVFAAEIADGGDELAGIITGATSEVAIAEAVISDLPPGAMPIGEPPVSEPSFQRTSSDGTTIVPEPYETLDAVTPPAAEPAEVAPPTSPSGPDLEALPPRPESEGPYSFRLDELRRAHALEEIPAEISADEPRRTAWQRGADLLKRRQAAIESFSLRAQEMPASSCYAGATPSADRLCLRFLLFPSLWPTGWEQATELAIVELDADGTPVDGWVVATEP